MAFEYLYLIELPTPTGDIGFGIPMCRVRDGDTIQRRMTAAECAHLYRLTIPINRCPIGLFGRTQGLAGGRPVKSGILSDPDRQAMGGCPIVRKMPQVHMSHKKWQHL
jgi:hypothetical protein